MLYELLDLKNVLQVWLSQLTTSKSSLVFMEWLRIISEGSRFQAGQSCRTIPEYFQGHGSQPFVHFWVTNRAWRSCAASANHRLCESTGKGKRRGHDKYKKQKPQGTSRTPMIVDVCTKERKATPSDSQIPRPLLDCFHSLAGRLSKHE